MKLIELMQEANTFYPDGCLEHYFDTEGLFKEAEHGGDSLARYIVIDLSETFDSDATDDEQLHEAKMLLHTALGDILSVLAGLDGTICWRGLRRGDCKSWD